MPRRGLLPSGESEHSHDSVDRRGMLADECEFIDDAEKDGRGVSVNVAINDQEWQRGPFCFQVPSTLCVKTKNPDLILGSGGDSSQPGTLQAQRALWRF